MGRITTEEWIKRAREVHGDKYDYSKSEYKGGLYKTCIICPIHGEFWQNAKSHAKGDGCPECGKLICQNCQRKTTEEFIEDAKKIYGDKYDYSKVNYIGSKIKVCIICHEKDKNGIEHGEFLIRPNDFMEGHSCKKCFAIKNSKQLEYNEMIEKFIRVHHNKYDYSMIESKNYYLDNDIQIICPKHGTFTQSVRNHLKAGCKECAIEKMQEYRKVDETEFKMRFNSISNNKFSYNSEEFINMNTPMTFKHFVCGTQFKRTPTAFLSNATCPVCNQILYSGLKTKTTEEFIEDAKNMHGDKFDYSNTKYSKSNEKVEIICRECGKTFFIEANSHLQGHGCPYHNINSSIKEKEIYTFISENIGKEAVSKNARNMINGNEIDIFVNDLMLGIEFDGLFWHGENIKSNDYHLNKTLLCESKNIDLIHIFEDEWDEKKNIVKSNLLKIIGCVENVVNSNECTIKEIDLKTANLFLNNNDLKGQCRSNINIGLYYNDELVSVMSLSYTHYFNNDFKNDYIIKRCCDKTNTLVINSKELMLNYFENTYKPKNIVIFVDRRWFIKNDYKYNGFKLNKILKPNYFYVIKNKRFDKIKLSKPILVKKYGYNNDINLIDFYKEKKWYRIFDCGYFCYTKNYE